MLKSFKSYIRESSDDEGQVLRDLLTNGLISRNEFYTLAKESGVPLQSEDYSYRYTVSLNVYAENIHLDNIPDWVAEKIDSITETAVLYTQHTNRHRYIADIVSNLEEQELIKSIEARRGPNDQIELEVTEIELH